MNRLTFEQEKKLIDYFRDHPSLWNTKDKDYNNRTLRTEKLEVIAKQLNLTRKDVYEKYRNLRTTFFREHKRVTNQQQQLQSANDGGDNGDNCGTGKGLNGGHRYVSRWRHYNHMIFLTSNTAHNNNNNMPNGINCNEGLTTHRRQTTIGAGVNACQITMMSNDDSVSLPNGHEIELMEENVGNRQSQQHQQQQILHQHHHVLQSAAANSDEIILINSTTGQPIDPNGHQHHPQTMAIQLDNVGIITNHHASPQRIFNSINSTTSSSQSSAIMSTIPIASVIQAATATNVASAQNIIQNVNGHRVGGGTAIHIDQQSSQSSTKPQPAVLIKYNNGTSTPIFMAASNQSPNPAQLTTTVTTNTGGTGSGQRVQQNLNQQIQQQSTTFSDFINPIQSQQQLGTSTSSTARKSSASIVFVSTSAGSLPATAINTKENASNNLNHQRLQFNNVSPTSFEMTTIQAQQQHFLRSSTATSPRQQQQAPLVPNGNGQQIQLHSQPQHSPKKHSSPTVIFTQNPLMPLASSTPIKNQNHPTSSVNQNNESRNGVSGSTHSNTTLLDIGEMREVIKNLVQEFEDAEMAFCRSLASSLRTLDRPTKDLAKLELQQVIVRYTNPNYSGGSTSVGGNGSSFSSSSLSSSFGRDGIPAVPSEASTNPNSSSSSSSTSSSPTTTTTASNAVSTIMMASTGQPVATQSAIVPGTHQQQQDLQKMITTASIKTSTTIPSMATNNDDHNNNKNVNNGHQQKMETDEDDGSSGS